MNSTISNWFKPVLLVCALLTTLLLPACNTDPEELLGDESESLEDYYEFQAFDLSEFDIPAIIMLPDETANIGASTRPEVLHTEDNFYWDVNVGPNFQIHIEDFGDNRNLIEMKKKDLSNQNMFKVNYLVDDADLLVYELQLLVRGETDAPKSVGVEHKSYHVYGQKIIDDITYEVRSRDEGYEKPIIELMAKSVRSLANKEKEPA